MNKISRREEGNKLAAITVAGLILLGVVCKVAELIATYL